MQRGLVKWFDEKRGFGFIKPDLGEGDIFVYSADIADEGEKVLRPGERVQFEIAEAAPGPRAVNVHKEPA
ncbi:MAG: cold-shock protein [bacterium]|jgi:CspA family cold shock protein